MDYKLNYLKYKNKYLNLKNVIDQKGGSRRPPLARSYSGFQTKAGLCNDFDSNAFKNFEGFQSKLEVDGGRNLVHYYSQPGTDGMTKCFYGIYRISDNREYVISQFSILI